LSDGEWTADHCNAGGKSGDRRSIAAFIVGPSGAALIEYHDEAVRVHRKTMRELEQLTKKDRDDWLPAILVDTPDMGRVSPRAHQGEVSPRHPKLKRSTAAAW